MSTPEAAQGSHKGAGTQAYAGFVQRVLRAYGAKARQGELDTTALTQLVELQSLLDDQIADTVRALRSARGGAYSWAAIGEGLGISREAACRKYGGADSDARRPGGQPAGLR
jgi:hypothetical protein